MSWVVHHPLAGRLELALVKCGSGTQLAVIEKRDGPRARVRKWKAKSKAWTKPMWLSAEHDFAPDFPVGSSGCRKLEQLYKNLVRAAGFEQLRWARTRAVLVRSEDKP